MSSLSQTPTPELPAKRHKKKPKLLFVVTEDWYFCSHRLPLAKEAIKQGFEVAIATRVAEHGEMIEAAGIKIYPWHVIRGSTNLWHEFVALMSLLKIYLSFRPTLVHQVALKSVLYGGFITMLVGPNKVVNAIGGMGSVFNEGKYSIKWLQFAILSIFKWLILIGHNMKKNLRKLPLTGLNMKKNQKRQKKRLNLLSFLSHKDFLKSCQGILRLD